MKKTYLRTAVIYAIAVLLIFILSISAFSIIKLREFGDSFYNRYRPDQTSRVEELFQYEGADMNDFLTSMYGTWVSDSPYRSDDTGFYGSIIDMGDYSTVISSQNFLAVTPDSYDYFGTRYILLGDDFPKDSYIISGSMTDGKCDYVYIFDGTLNWYADGGERSYYIERPDNAESDYTIPFSEWMDNPDYFHVRPCIYNSTPEEARLNREAEELSAAYAKRYESSEYENYRKDTELGIFRAKHASTYMIPIEGKQYLVTYCVVTRPLVNILRENSTTYIWSTLAFLVAEASVIMTFVTLYRNQKSFELRNRRLTRGIAHELKTPLAITKACVENWEYIDDDKRSEYAEKMITEVDHMSDLITKLLELSKLTSGNVTLKREPVDLMQLTKNNRKRMSDLINERKLDVSVTGGDKDDDNIINADLDMMNIVIDNFMSNAVKYSDSTIRIKIEKNGKKITYSITNDGAKIAKLDQKRVWDVFYKTDESRSDRIGSSGVGLSVVKNILDMHNAKYGCYSDDSGTTFWFTMDAEKKED